MGRKSGGILAIVAACLCLFVGIETLSLHYHPTKLTPLAIGILELLGFAFGLTAGALTLVGQMFRLAVMVAASTAAVGCVLWLAVFVGPRAFMLGGDPPIDLGPISFLFGALISSLAALATGSIAISGKEFVS